MMLLSLLLFGNAVLHGIIVGRFGIKGNVPPALFGLIYAALAFGVFMGWPHGALVTMVVTMVGLVGLTLNYKKLQHDTTIEKIIFLVGGIIIANAVYILIS